MVNHVGGGGRKQMINKIHLVDPAGSHTSQPDYTVGYTCRVFDKTGYFCIIICDWGRL